jgi:hypothetical protein
MRFHACFGLSLALVYTSVFADRPCPKYPCNATSRQELALVCADVADWIVEGTVTSIRNGTTEHTTYLGGNLVTFRVWNRGVVVLADSVLKKGVVQVLDGQTSIQGASFCWTELARVPEGWQGKRIRAYGLDRGGVYTHPGHFAVELVNE